MNEHTWTNAVNTTTLLWLAVFFVGFLAFDTDLLGIEDPIIEFPEQLETPWDVLSWIIWMVFAADVIFKYRSSANWKEFLKKHWFDIVLLIPFFRILRLLRLLRLLKTLKFAKVGLAGYKAYKKSKRFKKNNSDHNK
ncbi:hypothetical protein [Nitrosopumilus adriaticus]|uniref:hypothetical protein n=1 Tax=Nitrosopumilus adriaticus TaxID=1580092 RepID=UPI00352D702C